MVSVVQLVEHQVVVLEVAGSSPVTHPTRVGRVDIRAIGVYSRNREQDADQGTVGQNPFVTCGEARKTGVR